VAVVVALALLSAVLSPARSRSGSTAEQSPATVTVEAAVLRELPDAKAPAVATLSRGSRVTVLTERGWWLEARAENGKEGFLPVDSVERQTEREAREKRARTILSFQPVYGVVAEETDVLLAPFPMAARTGTLQKGEVIPILSVDHAYFAFRGKDGGVGFVHSPDVDLVPKDPTRPQILPEKMRALRDVTVSNLPTPEPEEGSTGEALPGEEGEALRPEEEGEPGPGPFAEVLEPAVLLSKVDPVYPDRARRAGVEGTVLLDVTIDATGRVTDVTVLRGLPLGVSRAADEAVRRWHYRPARGPEGPVASRKNVRILFTLSER
jgi:protein TonB